MPGASEADSKVDARQRASLNEATGAHGTHHVGPRSRAVDREPSVPHIAAHPERAGDTRHRRKDFIQELLADHRSN